MSSIPMKHGNPARFFANMATIAGTPATGLPVNSFSVTWNDSAGNHSMPSVVVEELTAGGFAGTGLYSFAINSVQIEPGNALIAITAPGCRPSAVEVHVSESDIDDVREAIRVLNALNTGRMTIDPGTKRMTLFDTDDTTVIARFELQDETGVPNVIRPYRRIPV